MEPLKQWKCLDDSVALLDDIEYLIHTTLYPRHNVVAET